MGTGWSGSGKPGRPTPATPSRESPRTTRSTAGDSSGTPIAAPHHPRAHPAAPDRIPSAEVTMTNTDPATTAEHLADHGWPVLPCHTPGPDRRCSCGIDDCPSPGKHPRTRRGLHDASTDPRIVTGWWRRWPSANPAIRTGSAPEGAGVVVLDLDPDSGGEASLQELLDAHRPLPSTLEVHTGGGGRHVYFAHPGVPIPNSAGRLGPGIDVRGDGGYVLVPPSQHISGRQYQWANDRELHPVPTWLLDLVDPARRRPSATSPAPVDPNGGPNTGWATAALTGETQNVRRATEGCRNHTLNRAAFALGQLVAGGHLEEHHVVATLTAAGTAVGLGEREVQNTIASGLRAGLDHPRHPASR